MTLDEKLGQLTLLSSGLTQTGPVLRDDFKEMVREGRAGSISNAFTVDHTLELQRIAVEETRLGIPLLFGFDVVHGYKTIFPILFGEAATWNPDLIETVSRAVARESAAAGLHWTFSPMIDVSIDPRWGRVAESAGEDPLLNAVFGAAKVRGYQGGDLADPFTIMATAKHSAGDARVVVRRRRGGERAHLFPFGYGLSYTTFDYRDLRLDRDSWSGDDSLRVLISVSNSGDMAGHEVVQLYTRTPVASVTRPVRELRNFRRLSLPPGGVETVSFSLHPSDLRYYDRDMKHVLEAGRLQIFVGPDSANVQRVEIEYGE